MGLAVVSNRRAGRRPSSEHAGATTQATFRWSHSLTMFFRMYQMILNGSRNGKSSSLISPIANWYPNGRSVLTGESNSMETWAFRSPSSKLAMWTFVLDRFLNIAHINFNLGNCRLRDVGVATSGVYTEGIFFGKAQFSRMLANAKPTVAGQKVDFWLGILCKVYNHDTTYNFLLLSSCNIFCQIS